VLVPLINSYIFVHITMKQYMPVVLVTGVVKIVHFCGKPVPIPDWQIENLRILTGTDVPMTTDTQDFEKGEEVLITQGALKGLRGRIRHIKGTHKLVISVHALDYNLTIDIDPGLVEGVPHP
jgi:transcription antitermination factor NusG